MPFNISSYALLTHMLARACGLEGLLAFRYGHSSLVGYRPHGKIEAPVAV